MLYGKLLHVRAGRRKACKWPMVHGRDLPIEYYLTDAFGTINRMYWALGFWTDPVSDEDLENAKKFFEDAGGVRHGGTPEFTEIKEWIDNGMPIAINLPELFMAIDGYLESNPSPSQNKSIIKIYKS